MKLMRHSRILFGCLVILLVNSCKNDLKVNAPYKEIPTIYAVINPEEKIKIIRINKVFLGEGDANKMAKIADSVNYQQGDLTVTLDHYDANGTQVDACPTCPAGNRRTITFRDSLLTTVPGAFNTTQRVYVSSAELHPGGNAKVDGTYKLTVTNNKTGNVFTAKASGIDSVAGNQGVQPYTPVYSTFNSGYSPPGAGTNNGSYINYADQAKTFHVYYAPLTDNVTAVYQVIIRVHFYDEFLNSNRIYRYVDYAFNNQYPKDAKTIAGQTYLDAYFTGKDFFVSVGASLAKLNLNNDDISGRKLYKLQYFVFSSTNEYIDYLQFSAPSLNISQNKPLYSNFDNNAALGLFTFRARSSVFKEPDPFMINEFQSNANTCKYRFFNSDNSRAGCGL